MTTPYTVPIKIGNLAGGPLLPATPVVDSVADHSVFPASLLESLGIEPLERMTFRRADGSQAEYDIGIASVIMDARERPCPVVFDPENACRLGVSTLAIFNLEDDPAGRRLRPASNLFLGLTESDGDAAKEVTPLRLTAVAPRADSRIWLRFSDGAAGEVDLSPLAGKGVFLAWADPSFFQSARLEDGVVTWGDELSLCSDALYLQLTGKSVGDLMPGSEGPGPAAARQIAALRRLPDGWRNGEGITFDTGYLDWLADAFARLYPPNAPAPTICPTTYGIVSLEWSLPDAEISLEIDPETHQGELVWANAHSANSGALALNMAEPEGWASLTDCFAKITGASE